MSGIFAVVVLPECGMIRAELMADAERQLRQPSRAGNGGLDGTADALRKHHCLLIVVLSAPRKEKGCGLAVAHWTAERALPNAPLLGRSEEHTSELQSLRHLVCRLL